MQKNTSFQIGCNYWPRKKAMYWWKDFDAFEVDCEFAEIAEYGWSPVRIFLLWEDFQPAPDKVSRDALVNLGTVLDCARVHGLQIMPTFFTGHMSGIDWWPVWALSDEEEPGGMRRLAGGQETTRKPRDPYRDPFLLAAQADLVMAVCKRYGGHPAIHSWDIANEPDLFAQPQSYAAGASWHGMLADVIRAHAGQPVSTGQHLGSIATPYNGFRPDLQTLHDTWLSMHAYSIFYPPTEQADPLCSDVVPLAALVTEALGGRPVFLQEIGYASTPDGGPSYFKWTRRGLAEGLQYFADDASGARYYREVLEKLARCGALGACAWMFSDVAPDLYGTPPYDTTEHERFFGLTRAEGTLKPSGEVMRDWAQRARQGQVPPRVIDPLDLDPEIWYQDAPGNFERLLAQWRGRL